MKREARGVFHAWNLRRRGIQFAPADYYEKLISPKAVYATITVTQRTTAPRRYSSAPPADIRFNTSTHLAELSISRTTPSPAGIHADRRALSYIRSGCPSRAYFSWRRKLFAAHVTRVPVIIVPDVCASLWSLGILLFFLLYTRVSRAPIRSTIYNTLRDCADGSIIKIVRIRKVKLQGEEEVEV